MPRKPTKLYTTPTGETVPAKYVKPYDKLRDRTAQRIAQEWAKMEARLVTLKQETLARIYALQAASAEDSGVPELGGKQGNIQFRSFDGLITVSMDNAKRTEFDERLGLAQELIMEAVQELAAGDHNADLVEIATKAFKPRGSGNLDMQRIRDLRNYNVKHSKWRKACEIISDCERTIGHKRYIRVAVRPNRDSQPKNIVLDIAAAQGSGRGSE